jgi:hypothetical protein
MSFKGDSLALIRNELIFVFQDFCEPKKIVDLSLT